MYDVFISYRRKQGFAVAKLFSGLLQAQGLKPFMDLEELRNGIFDRKILTAIHAAPAFVLILTPGALERCCDDDDWLTAEILEAVDGGRNIIPVLCDGFEWPKQWPDNIPEKIRILSKYNSVIMSYEYIDATVDKLVSYIRSDEQMAAAAASAPPKRHLDDLEDFFRPHMQHLPEIAGVDFAFHAGSVWHQDIERLEILDALSKAGVRVRVLVNTPETATLMGKHMRHKMKDYLPFEKAIALWRQRAEDYPNLEIRITATPLLRICYAIHMKDATKSAMRVKFYTHGNPKIDANFSQIFTADMPHYQLFRDEFDFLWEQCTEQ